MRWCITLAIGIALLFMPVFGAAVEPRAVVVFRSASGREIALSVDQQERLAPKIRDLLAFCGYHFEPDSPARVRDFRQAWERGRAGAHIYARFPTPFESKSDSGPKQVLVQEAVVGLEHKSFVSAEYSRFDDRIIGYGKCDGKAALRVMCDPAVRSYLLAGQEANCKVLDSWKKQTPKRGPD